MTNHPNRGGSWFCVHSSCPYPSSRTAFRSEDAAWESWNRKHDLDEAEIGSAMAASNATCAEGESRRAALEADPLAATTGTVGGKRWWRG